MLPEKVKSQNAQEVIWAKVKSQKGQEVTKREPAKGKSQNGQQKLCIKTAMVCLKMDRK